MDALKDIGRIIGFILLGCLVGGILGFFLGALASEVFRAFLVDTSPDSLSDRLENYGVEVYSLVFYALGWVGGLVVGGVSGLALSKWR